MLDLVQCPHGEGFERDEARAMMVCPVEGCGGYVTDEALARGIVRSKNDDRGAR